MNMNQLANMIMRMFIRKAVNKGMNVGINKVGQMRRPKKTAGGNAPRDTSERDRIRAERRARPGRGRAALRLKQMRGS